MQRFVVVHGQILLNQFKHFPVKAVRESAFALTLKSQMELRRHAKLYLKPAKAQRGHSNSNPMRDRASVKAPPMTATATTMVKAVWQSYFSTAAAAAAAEGVHGSHGSLTYVCVPGSREDPQYSDSTNVY